MNAPWFARVASYGHVLAIASLILGCGSDHPEHVTCDPDVSGYADGRWTSALGSSQEELPTLGQSASDLVYWFGPTVSREDMTLWWPTGGDVHVKMSYAAAKVDARLARARLVALVDGLQISLIDETGAAMVALPVRAPAGVTTVVEFTISADAIGTGSHNLVLVPIDEASGSFAFGTLLTVIKGAPGFSARRDDTSATTSLPKASFASKVLSNNMQLYLGQPLPTVGADGTVPLDLGLEIEESSVCTRTAYPLVATVLIDFKQVALDTFGPFVRVTVDGQHRRVLSVVAHGPAPDGARHVLTVLQYQGDGLYQAAPPDTLLPLSVVSPELMGSAYY